MQSNISQLFSFSQSYRRTDELPAPDDFPLYSETASIGKINVSKKKEIRIARPLFMTYFFRGKLALENPVQLAFVLCNDLEFSFQDSFDKLIDNRTGFYDVPVLATDPIPPIPTEEIQVNFPYRIAYQGISEFADYPTNSIPNYGEGSISKLINGELKIKIAQLYLIQSSTFSSNEDILIDNSNGYEFLYLIPFLPKIQGTEIAVSGRCNFLLEW